MMLTSRFVAQRSLRRVVPPSIQSTTRSTGPILGCGALRQYSPTGTKLNDEAVQKDEEEAPLFTKKDKKAAARDYNSRRANYRRHVSVLRKQYFAEYEKEMAAERARVDAEREEVTRRKLERQRLKNVRSARNAVLMEEARQQRAREFEAHLAKMQKVRDETKRRYQYARQSVIQELEAAAAQWLTSVEEVEAAFTHEAEQQLWAYPGGVLGEANPSVDSHFWQYESHTNHLDKTFQSPRELLLEDLLKRVYDDASIDYENYWTTSRIQERDAVVLKAKLRALVRAEGRRSLLSRQQELLLGYYETKEDEVPKRMPAPNVKILANIRAQEKEGVEILMNDPTKFFTFENQSTEGEGDTVYSGPTLGAPMGIRDPLRDGTPGNSVFPIGVAVTPKQDNRTQREKKRQEREQKMWEAAQAAKEASLEGGDDDDVYDANETISYDDNNWESDDEEWRKGLDPVEDADIINVPIEKRFSEADIKWVVAQLELRTEHLQGQLAREVDSSMQRLRTQAEDDTPDAMRNLTNDQVLALAEFVASNDLAQLSADEATNALKEIPCLEDVDLKGLVELMKSAD
ncbi:expressed unknown protein [Seminavis robusta]|uniref:Uncharacterized protein n=1 Tax=Seminavis robusta TaxID=568900 RepID=A0A9N8HEW3_9STRA|nr:expressed unknown protein [Seminavis robusta]|eukprot:Sro322_g116910.1 n/a (574) ;mRNA; r:5149-6870